MEILLAVAILGTVMSMIAMSLSGSFKVVDATEKQADITFQAQVAMQRIGEDFASAMALDDLDFSGNKEELNGQRADTVSFVSLAHLVFDPEKQQQGLGIIGYQLEPDQEDERNLKLLRSDELYLPGGKYIEEDAVEVAFLLCDSLRSVTFEYFDQEGQSFDEWDGESSGASGEASAKLPAAVIFSLEFWLDIEQETTLVFRSGVTILGGVLGDKE